MMSFASNLSMMANLSSTMLSLITSDRAIHYKMFQLMLMLLVVKTLPLDLTQLLGISVVASTFTHQTAQIVIQTVTYQLVFLIKTS